jgi:DNA-binding NarL/FixJ family response regulator
VPVNLLVVDDDPIFRLGLAEALNRRENFTVIGQESLGTILSRSIAPVPDILLIDPIPHLSMLPDWPLLAEIQRVYPLAKILLITLPLDANTELFGQRMGLSGYIPKGTSLEEILRILTSIGRGESHWLSLSVLAPLVPTQKSHWLIETARSGLAQIDDNIEDVLDKLSQSRLSGFDRFYWRGRKRELSAAAWLIKKLLPVPVMEAQIIGKTNLALPENLPMIKDLPIYTRSRPLTSSVVFEDTLAQIQSGLTNVTDVPLEIDILQTSAQRELLYITFNGIKQAIDDLRFLELSKQEISIRENLIVGDIWEKVTRSFLENYFISNFEAIFYEKQVIQEQLLTKIPFITDLLNYLILGDNLTIDGVDYVYNAPETIERAKILLQNLLNTIANGVMVAVLNNFSNVESLKVKLFKPEFVFTRKLTEFRNILSWKYTQEKYILEPKLIFESQERLFYYENYQIKNLLLYTSREQELKQLSGLRWLVTIALELRDALSPRFRAIFSVVGNGLVYFLIQVIGRGIGLIGRGILQGVGNGLGKTTMDNRSSSDKMP